MLLCMHDDQIVNCHVTISFHNNLLFHMNNGPIMYDDCFVCWLRMCLILFTSLGYMTKEHWELRYVYLLHNYLLLGDGGPLPQ